MLSKQIIIDADENMVLSIPPYEKLKCNVGRILIPQHIYNISKKYELKFMYVNGNDSHILKTMTIGKPFKPSLINLPYIKVIGNHKELIKLKLKI